jgi:thiamine-monophosphate kinase
MASERELLVALSAIFPTSHLPVGIGDDAAVLARPDSALVASADMAVEGVHFRRDWSSLHEIGAKVTAANLADIYAMGATPKYLLVTAALPRDFTVVQLKELARGIKSEADLVGVSVVGGDLSSSETLVISISALGEVDRPVVRSGAKVGDHVYLSSLTGASAAGLAQLTANNNCHPKFISAHKKPILDYSRAANFASANSMCDTSDGLLADVADISQASGVKIVLDYNLLTSAPDFAELAECATELGVDVAEWILGGGEDHYFVATSPTPIAGAIDIGIVVEGDGVEVSHFSGVLPQGYRHF